MPIAFIYVNKNNHINTEKIERLIEKWGLLAKINSEDITVNVIENMIQVGSQYKVMVKLYLPSLWNKDDIQKIQKSLYQSIISNLNERPEETIIMTMIIQSGHVIEKGEIVKW